MSTPTPSLTQAALKILQTPNPATKVVLTNLAQSNFSSTRTLGNPLTPPPTPARPSSPRIVPISSMPTHKTCNLPSNIFYLHSLAHVELNAIDLCFDTFLRFPGDEVWAEDWLSVAVDEARHFHMLSERLNSLGYHYGCMDAHDQILQFTRMTNDSVINRLALGQLVAEARGLDAGPKLAERLIGLGDKESADIVQTIAAEEVRHVKVGVRWFSQFCWDAGKDPVEEFRRIALAMANPGAFVPPFNHARRAEAGLSEDWYVPVAEEIKRLRDERRLKTRGLIV